MKFYKYYANGNDFVIFTDSKKANRSELAKTLCDRHSGIGADGLIVILPNLNMENLKAQNANFQAKNIKINEKNPTLQDKIKAKSENFDFEWEFYNCDGSDAFMCGNGSRAAAHFARHILGFKNALKFKTKAGIIAAKIDKNEVEVRLTPVKNEREVEFAGLSWLGCDTGVPHLVHFCEDLREFDPKICKKVRDKFNANVNFAKIVNENLIKVRTFERGVEGETMACGTGMAACFYLALKSKFIENKCQIEPKSKEKVFLKFDGENIYFKGLVRCCFEANYNF